MLNEEKKSLYRHVYNYLRVKQLEMVNKTDSNITNITLVAL